MVLRLIALRLRTIGTLIETVARCFNEAASIVDKKTATPQTPTVVEELTDEGQPIPLLPPDGYSEILPGDFTAYYKEQLRLRTGDPTDPRIDPEFEDIRKKMQPLGA